MTKAFNWTVEDEAIHRGVNYADEWEQKNNPTGWHTNTRYAQERIPTRLFARL